MFIYFPRISSVSFFHKLLEINLWYGLDKYVSGIICMCHVPSLVSVPVRAHVCLQSSASLPVTYTRDQMGSHP